MNRYKNLILIIFVLFIILLAAIFSSCDLFMPNGSIYIQWDDELGYIIANGEEYSTSPVKLLPDFDNLNIDFKFHSTDIEKIWTFDSWDVFEVKDMFVTVAHDSYYTERNSEISIEKDVYYELTAIIRKSNEFYLASSAEY